MNNSWSKQFSGSNNTYYTMPPMMSDGRNYSSWQPESVLNDKIKQDAGINSNWKYRQYLQQNANNIMKLKNIKSESNKQLDQYDYNKILDDLKYYRFDKLLNHIINS